MRASVSNGSIFIFWYFIHDTLSSGPASGLCQGIPCLPGWELGHPEVFPARSLPAVLVETSCPSAAFLLEEMHPSKNFWPYLVEKRLGSFYNITRKALVSRRAYVVSGFEQLLRKAFIQEQEEVTVIF